MTDGADSAGVPWEGRSLAPHPFAGDDGTAPEALLAALVAASEEPLNPHRHRAVLRALAGTRLFTPILAQVLESEAGADGLMRDNSSDMAMVRLAASDGRETIPGFTDVPSLTAWRAGARPVPVEAERLALAAVSDGDSLVVLDAGTEHSFLVRRPALWAFAQGEGWAPAWADAEVHERVRSIAEAVTGLGAVTVRPGSAAVQAQGPEVGLVIEQHPGGKPEGLPAFQAALAADELLATRVDSFVIAVAG